MAKFIKLQTTDGEQIWVNPDHILYIIPAEQISGASFIKFETVTTVTTLTVDVTPQEIIDMIDKAKIEPVLVPFFLSNPNQPVEYYEIFPFLLDYVLNYQLIHGKPWPEFSKGL